MNIIIVGCGKTGYTIAKHLSEDQHSIVLIDKKPFDSKVIESIDVMTLQGNALSGILLREAGVKEADLMISVAENDETNILCCLTAQKLGAKHTIARVRDPAYAGELLDMREDLGLDMIINPEQQAALEISRLLRFPSASDIDTFAGGQLELIAFPVLEGDIFKNLSIAQIICKLRTQIVFALVERESEAIIPHGNFVLQVGDVVRILGRPSQVTDFFKSAKKLTGKVKNAMIIGGGKVTFYLAQFLERHQIECKIIEKDLDKCNELTKKLPHTLVIHGDGTDQELLYEENVKKMDSVICLTNRDEENIVLGLHCIRLHIPKTIVKVNHISLGLTKNLGLGSIICPKNITALQIINYVRGLTNAFHSNTIISAFTIFEQDESRVDALEFNILKPSQVTGIPIRDLRIREDILIGSIIRKGKPIPMNGSCEIHVNDVIIIIAKDSNIVDLDEILETDDFLMEVTD